MSINRYPDHGTPLRRCVRRRGGDPGRDPRASSVATSTDSSDNLDELIAAARSLIVPGERHFLGVTGAPGSGKSTLAEVLATALGADAVLVAMDGFHLANAELKRLNRHARKGAPDTFDAAGYVNLLRRLHERDEPVVYAPRFDRALEESIGSAVPVPHDIPLVITEGNYLLVDGPDWGPVRPLLDECWYVESDEDVRLDRLIARHVSFGRAPHEAHARSHGSDGRNAEIVKAYKARATRVVRVPAFPPEPVRPPTRGTTSEGVVRPDLTAGKTATVVSGTSPPLRQERAPAQTESTCPASTWPAK